MPCILFSLCTLSPFTYGEDFCRLDEALLSTVELLPIPSVFDFDNDGCLPSAGISRSGKQNSGLAPTGSLTGTCTSTNFLETSNTPHRYSGQTQNGNNYCGHFFALCFEKDQMPADIQSGHRHHWEYAAK